MRADPFHRPAGVVPRRPAGRRTARMLAELLGRTVDEFVDQDGFLSYEVQQRARAARAQAIASAVVDAARAATRAVSAFARTAYARHRQQREARAVRRMLSELDDHTLRDLGLSRVEIPSAAAEAAGLAEHSRRRIEPARWAACP